jgi:membrane protein
LPYQNLHLWYNKDPFRESAVIAYYSIFSLPGLLVVIITLAGYIFGRDAVNNNVARQITSTLGADTAEQIQNMIIKASVSNNSVWATIIGVVTIIIGATGVFAQFQKSLNNIWEVKTEPSKSGIWSIIRVRLFSFGMIVSIAFILIVSLVISTLLSAFGNWLSGIFLNLLLFSFKWLISLSLSIFSLSYSLLCLKYSLMQK